MKGEILGGRLLVLHPTDTVGTAIEAIDEGERISMAGETLVIAESIPFGHKVALATIESGGPVRKYGEVIGQAMTAIEPGDWVHTHNLESRRGRGDRTAEADA